MPIFLSLNHLRTCLTSQRHTCQFRAVVSEWMVTCPRPWVESTRWRARLERAQISLRHDDFLQDGKDVLETSPPRGWIALSFGYDLCIGNVFGRRMDGRTLQDCPSSGIVSKVPFKTVHAIILSLEDWYFTAQFLRRGPRLCQYLFNHLRDGVCAHINRPRQVGNGIVLDDVSQVATALHGISPYCATRSNTVARTHGDRIRGVPNVSDVMCRWGRWKV